MSTSLVTSLTQRTGVLNKKLAAYLLRRSSFHFSKDKVDALANMTAGAAVNNLFNNASPAPYLPRPLNYEETTDPDWIPLNTNAQEGLRRQYVAAWWFQNALLDQTANHKSAFFLHTIYATSHVGLSVTGNLSRDVSRFLFDHFALLKYLVQVNKDLKEVARKMTLDNLMLGYLNNRTNIKTSPNENYAREFLELFTIGRGTIQAPGEYSNYNESDISVAAELLTGFTTYGRRNTSVADPDTGILAGRAIPSRHTPGDKQFSNKFSGDNKVEGLANPTVAGMKNELDQFIDMVFNQFATAENYARKMYKFYVSNNVDEVCVTALANDLVSNGFKHMQTIKKLLKSDHFYSRCSTDYGGGDILKSPFELLAEGMSFFGTNLPEITDPTDLLQIERHFRRFGSIYMFNDIGENGGMKLFGPPSVAGYPAYYQEPLFDRNWYNPGTITTRYGIAEKLVKFYSNIYTNIDTLAYTLFLHEQRNIEVSNANLLLDEIVDYLLPQELTAARRTILLNIFLFDEAPQNWYQEWTLYYGGTLLDGTVVSGSGIDTGVRPHLDALVIAALASQEYQLK